MKKVQNKIKTPLFWELHCHGVQGLDFMRITNPDEIFFICEAFRNHGIGYFFPTLLTDSPEQLLKGCETWGNFISKIKNLKDFPQKYALPVGLHLEGPFLSKKMAGAHPKNFINEPSIDLMKKYLKASKNQIKIVTLAPESNTAFKLIKFLNKNKIRVQIGHTVATDKQIDLAIKSGAKGVTHLYNAIYIHHRNPSVLPYILNQKLTAELITDTFHIDAKMCAFLIQIFSKSIYGVSDCCSALGVDKNSNLKKLTLGSLNIIKKDKIALTKDLNILAGGASWLTEHPFLLKKAFLKNPNIIIPNQEKIFSLYYKIQNKLFIKEIIKLKRNGANFFNQNSYKWLYTTSKP